jgi:GntR family transcriptional regulator
MAGKNFQYEKIPIYYQLENILREKILSGEFAEGEQLPPETELIRQYNVSRITVRHALDLLAQEGLVKRIRGRGTFVTRHKSVRGTIRLTGFLEDLMAMGIETTARVLEFRRVSASPDVASSLQVDVGTPIWLIKRVRYVKNTPYSYILNYVPEDIGEKVTREELEKGSLLKLIEEKMSIRLGEALQVISATLADTSVARVLHTRVGAPLLFIERIVYTTKGRAVEYVRTLYRSDLYCYTVKLVRGPKEIGTGWHYLNAAGGQHDQSPYQPEVGPAQSDKDSDCLPEEMNR